jgi:protein SCO1/2
MSNINRRNFFSLLGAASTGLALSQTVPAQTATPVAGAATVGARIDNNDDKIKKMIAASREKLRERYFPNVELITHEGKKVRFYDDLIKDKIITLNFMYATCDGICPTITRNLAKVQQMFGEMVGRELFMYSITLKPALDTPEVLYKHAQEMNVKPGWLFLTGKPEDIELIRRKQGFVDPDPELDKDKTNHIGNVRFGNEPMQTWAACPGLGKPELIVESLLWMDSGFKAKYLAQREKIKAAGETPVPDHQHNHGSGSTTKQGGKGGRK